MKAYKRSSKFAIFFLIIAVLSLGISFLLIGDVCDMTNNIMKTVIDAIGNLWPAYANADHNEIYSLTKLLAAAVGLLNLICGAISMMVSYGKGKRLVSKMRSGNAVVVATAQQSKATQRKAERNARKESKMEKKKRVSVEEMRAARLAKAEAKKAAAEAKKAEKEAVKEEKKAAAEETVVTEEKTASSKKVSFDDIINSL